MGWSKGDVAALQAEPHTHPTRGRPIAGANSRSEDVVAIIFVRLKTEPVGAKHEVELSYVKRNGVKTTELNGAYNRIKIFFTPTAGPPGGVDVPSTCVSKQWSDALRPSVCSSHAPQRH